MRARKLVQRTWPAPSHVRALARRHPQVQANSEAIRQAAATTNDKGVLVCIIDSGARAGLQRLRLQPFFVN